MTNTTKNISIYAEALIDNMNYKSKRVNGEAVGVSNARQWVKAVKDLLVPAYRIRVYRYNNMGNSEIVTPCDESPLYTALQPVLEMIGEVNGAKLDAHNCAEEIISNAMKFKVIDISNEMAHARSEKREADKALRENECEETQAEFDKWVEECKRLEALPGNCKRITDIQADSAFIKAVEHLLGAAITKQQAKSAEEVEAEREARRQARRARTAAKKAEKKAQAK